MIFDSPVLLVGEGWPKVRPIKVSFPTTDRVLFFPFLHHRYFAEIFAKISLFPCSISDETFTVFWLVDGLSGDELSRRPSPPPLGSLSPQPIDPLQLDDASPIASLPEEGFHRSAPIREGVDWA